MEAVLLLLTGLAALARHAGF